MPKPKLDEKTIERGLLLGRRIAEARARKRLTQLELSLASGVKIDTLRSIEKEETGKVYAPNIFIVADLAEALGEDLRKWLK